MPRANPGPSRQHAVRWPVGLLEAVEAQAKGEQRTVGDMLKILVGLGLTVRARQGAGGAPHPRRRR